MVLGADLGVGRFVGGEVEVCAQAHTRVSAVMVRCGGAVVVVVPPANSHPAHGAFEDGAVMVQ